MAGLLVEEPDAYEWMDARRRVTYDRPITVARITHGEEMLVIVPVGIGHECDDGHEVMVYPNEAAFLMKYSWQRQSRKE